MFKESLRRGALCYCVCVTAANLASMVVGFCGAQTNVPDFVERVGNPVAAAFLQPLLIGWIGFAFGAGSVLFEVERLSFLQQGAAHLAATLPAFFAVELACFGMDNVPGLLSFAASAALSYAATWLIQYFVWRAKVRRLDREIRRRNAAGAARG